jgi:hypothetical protein
VIWPELAQGVLILAYHRRHALVRSDFVAEFRHRFTPAAISAALDRVTTAHLFDKSPAFLRWTDQGWLITDRGVALVRSWLDDDGRPNTVRIEAARDPWMPSGVRPEGR